MPNLNSGELDDLFREGADMQKFEYNQEAWDQLSHRLDDDRKRRRMMLLAFSMISILLVLGISSLYYASKEDVNLTQEISTTEYGIEQKKHPVLTPDLAHTQLKDQNIENINTPLNDNLGENSVHSIQAKVLAPIKSVKIESQSQNLLLDASPFTSFGINQLSTFPNIDDKQSVQRFIKPDNTVSYSEGLVATMRVQTIDKAPYGPRMIIDPHMHTAEQTDLLFPSNTVNNGFAVGLSVSPEWSSVGMGSFGKIGWKAETRLAYQFSSHWEFGLGIAYSKKSYQSKGETFRAATPIWTDNVIPMFMEGQDEVVEIPLELNYYLQGYNKNSLFAGVGIRSYMMHAESFEFEYHPDETRTDLIKEYEMKDENSHWLGVVRFHIGYHARVNKYTSVQFTPYVQIPIVGIGEGQQMLYSAGIQLTTRFNTL